MTFKKNIFMTAYDVNPFKGSESGMGWNFAFEVSKLENVMLVTRCNNRAAIDRWIDANRASFDAAHLTISYFDLPKWVLWIKSGRRLWHIYYLLWQFFVAFKFRQEIRNSEIAHALNFHTTLFPSFLWIFNKNFFWGPINHHEKIPFDQVKIVEGWLGALIGELGWLLKLVNWQVNPLLILCQMNTKVCFVGSSAVEKRWYGPKRPRFVDLSSVGISSDFGSQRDTGHVAGLNEVFTFLSVGRFITMKSFELTILAYNEFLKLNPDKKNTRLVIIGSGSNQAIIEEYSESIQSNGEIEIINWVDYSEMAQFFSSAHVFVFPSHEGAGMVVAEAMATGLPVLCLKNNGPAEIARESAVSVQYCGFHGTKLLLADEMDKLYNSESHLMEMSSRAKLEAEKYFWEVKGKKIVSEYQRLYNE